MARQLTKSIHVALAAVAASTFALAATAIWLGAPDEVLSRTYGTALARATISRQVHAAGINGPGSEQFWLTKDTSASNEGALRTLALGDRFTIPELTAVAGTTAAGPSTLEVIDVEEIPHAGRGGRMLLITAKTVSSAGIGVLAGKDELRPPVRFVIDLEAVAPQGTKIGRSL